MSAQKVLYVCPSAGLGGAETFIKSTWLGHDKTKFQCSYLLFTDGPLRTWLENHGAPVRVLKNKPRISRPDSWLKTHKELKEFIRAGKFDLVHSTMAYGALFTAHTTGDIPHVWFQHGPVSGWMDSLADLWPSRGFIANSQYTFERQLSFTNPLRDQTKTSRQNLVLALGTPPCELAETQIASERKDLLQVADAGKNALIFSMACRIQEWKGVHVFLEAIRLLKDRMDLPPFFAFIWGEAFKGNAYYKKLQKQADGLPVRFAGTAGNVQLALAASDVLVNASTQPEPFGLTVIEAMACGTVPVAPDIGGPSEIITDGEDGLLFQPGSASGLADKLQLLLQNPKHLANLKKAARESHAQKYTLDLMMKNLENYYSQILRNR